MPSTELPKAFTSRAATLSQASAIKILSKAEGESILAPPLTLDQQTHQLPSKSGSGIGERGHDGPSSQGLRSPKGHLVELGSDPGNAAAQEDLTSSPRHCGNLNHNSAGEGMKGGGDCAVAAGPKGRPGKNTGQLEAEKSAALDYARRYMEELSESEDGNSHVSIGGFFRTGWGLCCHENASCSNSPIAGLSKNPPTAGFWQHRTAIWC